MKARRDRRWLQVVAVAVGLGLLGLTRLSAQTNQEAGILFLHLKLNAQGGSLVKSTFRPGVLKPQPNPEGRDLVCEVISAKGETLWKGGLDDPRVQRFEYEDPPRSGRLKRKEIRREEAEFTLRVPALSEARRLEIYRLAPAGAGGKGEPGRAKKSCGSIVLPPKPTSGP